LRVKEKDGEEYWSLDMSELEAAISAKTKAIILNTPHNPTGKVCTTVDIRYVCINDFLSLRYSATKS
jgi:aspartate/methionine/tyrosine aminotransferase